MRGHNEVSVSSQGVPAMSVHHRMSPRDRGNEHTGKFLEEPLQDCVEGRSDSNPARSSQPLDLAYPAP